MAQRNPEYEALSPDATTVDRTVHLVRGAFRNVIIPAAAGAAAGVNEAVRGGVKVLRTLFSRS